MFEQLGFENLSPKLVSAWFGLFIGLLFGVLAQRSQFCLRRSLVEPNLQTRKQALSVWLTALVVAMLLTQLMVMAGMLDFTGHRFHSSELPVVAIVAGGLLFGIGMVLTRGCASRLTVLFGTGNLRALMVLVVFAIVAHATLKGALAPLRVAAAQYTIDTSLFSIAGWAVPVILLLAVVAVFRVVNGSGVSRWQLLGGVGIGSLVALAWLGTGLVLQDEFDPIAVESLSFTSTAADWLFWTVAGTSVGAGFGVGLFSGVVAGSALAALIFREFNWVSFESPGQTGRYLLGAVCMGIGGVLAGGCTVGAGLSGMSVLGPGAAIALLSIVAGAYAMNTVLGTHNSEITASHALA